MALVYPDISFTGNSHSRIKMTAKPTRFLLVSTHVEQVTGYAKVAYNLLKQLSTLHPIVKTFHFGFQRSPVRGPSVMRPIENVTMYDAAANEDPRQQGFGFNKLAEYIDTCSPDIVMIYNDPIVVNQFLEAIKNVPKTFQVWVYLDQVYEGCDQGLLRNIEKAADRIFCFTEKWMNYLKSRIPTTEKTLSVLEHGVDTAVFNRLSAAERIATRKQMNMPADAILFLNMNRNSERKRLDLSVMAFVRLLERNPDLPLYMLFVTSMNPQSGAHYNPIQIFMNELTLRKLDVLKYGQRIVTLDTAPPKMFDDRAVNTFYNACDYGINTANGEGFGLCQLEHLATGAPQVVINSGDYRAFLTDEVAEIVEPSSYSYLALNAGIGLTQKSATAEEVADAMGRVLSKKNVDKCIELAKSRPWSRICDGFLEIVATYSPT
jgi:glycosyltransferase involved in cell wall biosynthesis